MALLFTACGGESGAEEGGTTTSMADSGVTTAAAATDTTEPTTPTTAGGDESGSGDSSGLPEMSGGSATLTLGGETEEFDWFVCFSGDAVAVVEEDEDITFIAIGRRGGSFPSQEGVEAQIVVARIDSPVGLNDTILYTRIGGDGAETNWQGGGFDAAQIEGDRVTFEGELSPIIDNQPSDEASEMGALDATCSPNSIGS
jgi:hypothetical protein